MKIKKYNLKKEKKYFFKKNLKLFLKHNNKQLFKPKPLILTVKKTYSFKLRASSMLKIMSSPPHSRCIFCNDRKTNTLNDFEPKKKAGKEIMKPAIIHVIK